MIYVYIGFKRGHRMKMFLIFLDNDKSRSCLSGSLLPFWSSILLKISTGSWMSTSLTALPGPRVWHLTVISFSLQSHRSLNTRFFEHLVLYRKNSY